VLVAERLQWRWPLCIFHPGNANTPGDRGRGREDSPGAGAAAGIISDEPKGSAARAGLRAIDTRVPDALGFVW